MKNIRSIDPLSWCGFGINTKRDAINRPIGNRLHTYISSNLYNFGSVQFIILMGSQHHDRCPSSQPPQVLVIRPPPVFTVHEQYISNKFHILKAYDSALPTHDFLQANAQFVKAVLCSGNGPITADVLRDLPALQLVVSTTTGVNHIDMAECRKRGIKVTNIQDVFSDDVADVAVGLLINVMRRITGGHKFVRGGCWPVTEQYPLGSKLGGKKIGIVGLGNIGSKVATRLYAMGCIVSYTSRQIKDSPFTFYPNVLKLALDSDALILCCALTNDTRHMINNKVMMALGKKGIIVNVARGAVIDEAELVKCLVEGEIGGAGLDVYENEPNVPKELFGLDNVVVLPHSSACTNECFQDAAEVAIGNLEAFFANKPLITPVTNDF
ncbi:putative oxidoreductase [Helianthus anomalus]